MRTVYHWIIDVDKENSKRHWSSVGFGKLISSPETTRLLKKKSVKT